MDRFEVSLQYEKEGRYAKAFELLQQCLGEETYNQGEIFFHCGWCCENDPEGDKKRAIGFYQQAAAFAPPGPLTANSFFRTGWLFLHEKDYARAALHFRKAIDCAEKGNSTPELYHHSAYWFAACLEMQGQYLEALDWYRRVEAVAPLLAPESRFRQILCLNKIGLYEAALEVCCAFETPAPPGFLQERYDELVAAARNERKLLERVLAVHP